MADGELQIGWVLTSEKLVRPNKQKQITNQSIIEMINIMIIVWIKSRARIKFLYDRRCNFSFNQQSLTPSPNRTGNQFFIRNFPDVSEHVAEMLF